MDIIDQAQHFEQINLDQALRFQRVASQYTVRPVAKGYCLNRECSESFGADKLRLYCGPDCADRHHKQINR